MSDHEGEGRGADDVRDGLPLRDLMDTLTDGLAPPPGLGAGAVAAGRRRRRRARAAAGAAAVCAVALAVNALTAVHGRGGPGDPVGPVAPASAPAPASPARTFGYVDLPSQPGDSADSGSSALPESPRVAAFRQRTAAVLHDLLPAQIGTIRLVAGDTSGYVGTSARGTFFIRFSVLPAPGGTAARTCQPGEAAKGGSCRVVKLPGGVPAVIRVVPEGSGGVTETSALFRLGGSDVAVSVSPDDDAGCSAPVTSQQMASFATAKRVLDLVREADADPVQKAGATT